ncbi:hypothetical protein M758_10G136100 [Ceratodon purpureus]|nr:hypothetical protein M758_10G136100 [Ceratodon purpureus]
MSSINCCCSEYCYITTRSLCYKFKIHPAPSPSPSPSQDNQDNNNGESKAAIKAVFQQNAFSRSRVRDIATKNPRTKP